MLPISEFYFLPIIHTPQCPFSNIVVYANSVQVDGNYVEVALHDNMRTSKSYHKVTRYFSDSLGPLGAKLMTWNEEIVTARKTVTRKAASCVRIVGSNEAATIIDYLFQQNLLTQETKTNSRAALRDLQRFTQAALDKTQEITTPQIAIMYQIFTELGNCSELEAAIIKNFKINGLSIPQAPLLHRTMQTLTALHTDLTEFFTNIQGDYRNPLISFLLVYSKLLPPAGICPIAQSIMKTLRYHFPQLESALCQRYLENSLESLESLLQQEVISHQNCIATLSDVNSSLQWHEKSYELPEITVRRIHTVCEKLNGTLSLLMLKTQDDFATKNQIDKEWTKLMKTLGLDIPFVFDTSDATQNDAELAKQLEKEFAMQIASDYSSHSDE